MDEVGTKQWEGCLRDLGRRGFVRRSGNATYAMKQLFSGVSFSGAKVLDIGGGAGLASFYAACMGAESVTCLEPGASGSNATALSVPRFDPTSDRLSRVKFSNMTFQEYLAGPSSHFDVVLSVASINHLDEPACVAMNTPAGRNTYRGLLGGVRGVVKPGGQLVVMDCFRWNALEFSGLHIP